MAKRRKKDVETICDTCFEVSSGRPPEPCGRNLTEELIQTLGLNPAKFKIAVICPGTINKLDTCDNRSLDGFQCRLDKNHSDYHCDTSHPLQPMWKER